jgi:uncharacterized membrane protein
MTKVGKFKFVIFRLYSYMAELDEIREIEEKGLNRILALSDGVFAFALTLLVLDLVVPAYESNQNVLALPSILVGEWSGFFSYFLSFSMIAIWWNTHHRYFEHIRGYDGQLKALNILTLLPITLSPFLTKLLDTWNTAPFATALYAFDQGAAAMFLSLTWRHASKDSQFIDKNLSQKEVNAMRATSIVPPIFFFLSIPLVYFGFFFFSAPQVAWAFWYVMFPVSYIIRRHARAPGTTTSITARANT